MRSEAWEETGSTPVRATAAALRDAMGGPRRAREEVPEVTHGAKTALATPSDISEAVQQSRSAKMDLRSFLDLTTMRIQQVEVAADFDLGALEDFWTDAELVYALASEAGRNAPDPEQTHAVEEAIGGMVKLLVPAL